MTRSIAAALGVTGAILLATPAIALAGEAAALKRELGPGVRVAAHESTGKVRFVGTTAGRPIPRPAGVSGSAAPRDVARRFLAQHENAFGIADASRDLRVISSHATSGRPAVRFQQLRSGIPVLGGELVVNLDHADNVLSASGEAGAAAPTTTPLVNSAAARQAAIALIAKREGVSAARLQASDASRWVYDARLLGGPGPHTTRLVWRLEVKGTPGLAVNQLVLVDAETGIAVLNVNQIESARTQRVCDAGNTLVPASGSFPCTLGAAVATEPGDPPGVGDDNDVAPAYRFAADTYDFYFGRFGRRSLDDEDMTLVSTVDYCDPNVPSDCPNYDNAFWNGSQMAYGNGYAAGDDVVGHELTHGVTDFSAHLLYYYQSGAINESLSDVMGEFIDQTNTPADPPADKWQIGEDIPGGAIRNMANPPASNAPDSMTSPRYFGGEGDNGGVHTNSGVNNKAAYLMTDGDTFGGQTITGIGVTKAARVYYDAQTRYLTSGSDYADLASALPQACADNVGGSEGITADNCTQVSKAVAAVAMRSDPGPPVEALDAPAASCPSGQRLTTLFLDDMERFATANSNWTTNNAGIWGPTTDYTHSGDWALSGGDSSARTDSNVAMTTSVTIPAGVTAAYVRFDHAYGFEDDDQGAYDGGVVEYSTDNGATYIDAGPLFTVNGYDGEVADFGTPSVDSPLAGRQAFIRESHGYISSLANLTTLKGRSVRFRFRIGTDNTVGDLGWAFDDVRVFSCTTPSPPPPTTGGGGTTPGGGSPPVAEPPGGGTGTGQSPRLAAVRLRSCKISGTGRKLRVKCTLRSFASVRRAAVTIKKGRKTVLKKTLRPNSKGVLSIKPRKKLRKGSYKLTIKLIGAGGRTRTLKAKLKVR